MNLLIGRFRELLGAACLLGGCFSALDDVKPSATCIDCPSSTSQTASPSSPSASASMGVPSACEAGLWDNDQDAATPCVAKQECSAGEHVVSVGSATEDQVCGNCAEGEFSTAGNRDCSALSRCKPGTYVAIPGDATHDQSCEPCRPGEFSTSVDAAACKPFNDCAPGTYVKLKGDTTHDQTCGDCAKGQFTAQINQDACSAWSDCAAGTYIKATGSATRDQECKACASGSFAGDKNLKECGAWTVCKAPSEFESNAPTAILDRKCGSCPASSMTVKDNDTACFQNAFQMANDEVSIEAEHFQSSVMGNPSATWTVIDVSSISGAKAALIGTETNGLTWVTDPATNAPRMDYRVNFTSSGTYHFYIRGDSGAASGASDSCYAGVDGIATASYSFNMGTGVWGWTTLDVSVTSPGVHVVSVLGREDGFRVDKLVLTKSSTAPSGNGPAESPIQ